LCEWRREEKPGPAAGSIQRADAEQCCRRGREYRCMAAVGSALPSRVQIFGRAWENRSHAKIPTPPQVVGALQVPPLLSKGVGH
jgi:hypothetical protein